MATRFYFPASGTPAVTPASWESVWTAAVLNTQVTRPLVTTKSNTTIATTGHAEAVTTNPCNNAVTRFVSDTLDVDQTITGNFTGVFRLYESSTAANASLQVVVRVMSQDGTTERGVLFAGHSTANTTTASGNFGYEIGSANGATRLIPSTAFSSVSALAGDRIVIELGSRNSNSLATSYTTTYWFGDTTATADYAYTYGLTTSLCPWVEFTQTLTFGTPATSVGGFAAAVSGATGTVAPSEVGGFAAAVSGATGTVAPPAAATVNLFTTTPSIAADPDAAALSVGTQFYASSAGCEVTQIRFLQPSSGGNTNARVCALYSTTNGTTGTMVAGPFTMPTPTAGTWCTYTLTTPYAMTSGTTYVAVVLHPAGKYAATGDYFATGAGSTNLVQGVVTRPSKANALGTIQGGYNYAASISFPDETFGGASYYSDVTISVPVETTGGFAAAVSGATGTVAKSQVGGFAAAVTAATATVARSAVGGFAAAVSGATATVARSVVGGFAAAVSSATGTVEAGVTTVGGFADAVSGATGTVARSAATGFAAAVSGATATVSRSAATGFAAAISGATGTVARSAATGFAAAVSGATGTVARSAAGGYAAAVSGATATVARSAAGGFAGVVSAAYATVARSQVAGVAEATSGSLGEVLRSEISGLAAAVSAAYASTVAPGVTGWAASISGAYGSTIESAANRLDAILLASELMAGRRKQRFRLDHENLLHGGRPPREIDRYGR